VPGPIDSPRSAGANLLLRDGAQVIHSVDDALMLFGLTAGRKAERATLGAVEAAVWDALADGSATVEAVADRTGLAVRSALEGIARLELNGMVRQGICGEIERVRMT
jgi:DNA processing protein